MSLGFQVSSNFSLMLSLGSRTFYFLVQMLYLHDQLIFFACISKYCIFRLIMLNCVLCKVITNQVLYFEMSFAYISL